ncbi:hypothetical protein ATI61_10643 [Archangium gephyra]|uniref:Lipoprotein n=1 Tax=Archangium gephyra TaxID=48 RepID=A0AAC8Q0B6_9BACT|nr:hypothetical protein [Archangium gephyra]AKI98642.1 putative lipoprotein [Archangium gephyra]REG30574.1 hypothetical protein ATI61_10643 [Archangium gephyra]
MTRSKFILAGLIAGAMALGTACKSDKAAEMPPADPSTTEETTPPPATDQGGTTTTPPGGTGGAGDVGADDFEAPIPDTGATIPEDYGGSGTMNPENPGTGGAGDISQDEVIQDDIAVPESAGGAGLQDDMGTGTTDTGTTDTGAAQTKDQDIKVKDKAKTKAKAKAREKSGTEGTGGSGLEDDQRFEGDSFPSDSERVNEPAPPPAGAPVPTP